MPVVGPQNNRTDLTVGKPEKVTTAPDQAYGNQTAQQQSQKILPIGGTPVPTAAPVQPSAGSQPAAPAPAPGPAAAPTPGTLPWVNTPTARPNEPLTTPATGPLAQLAAAQQNENGSLKQLMGHLATLPGSTSVIKGLAAAAGATVS